VTDRPEFLLPHEILAGGGVPDALRDDVQYRVVTSKYCALVEAAMKVTGGEPLRVSLERVKEIHAMTHHTDPSETVMVAETKPGGIPGPIIEVRLATIAEIQDANRRYALSRMGARRN
jgi:hypothetical protein